jgi:hypothetical protein
MTIAPADILFCVFQVWKEALVVAFCQRPNYGTMIF